jgi:XTP/dITP diphosphohydrolase
VKLLVATSNQGKLGEVREILAPLLGAEHSLVSLDELRLPAPDEPFATFHENAAQKASVCAAQSKLWTLGDDSGLCVDALSGAPGVYSARYAPTEAERRQKLLGALAAVPASRRNAHFFCAVALAAPGGQRLFRAEGRAEGRISTEARGQNGFGYDPLFLPDETPGSTLAELSTQEKNRLSHRGRALRQLRPLLEKLLAAGDL